jgi:hypothetical protein
MMTFESFNKRVKEIYCGNGVLGLFLRYFLIFFLLLLSLASYALFRIIAAQSNPFFYAKF